MKKKTILCIVIICLLVVLLLVLYRVIAKDTSDDTQATDATSQTGSAVETYVWDDLTKVELEDTEYGLTHDVTSWLIIGTDNSGDQDAVGADYTGAMADFLLLVVIDETEHTYGSLQLNRDTMTKIHLINKDGEGEATAKIQLCTAHWYGGNRHQGSRNTVQAVSDLLGGVPIDGYYEIPMDNISDLNSLTGGVTVTLEDDFTEVDPEMEVGATLTLTDEQAYHFIHDRMNIGDGENTSRMRRQKQYMDALGQQVLQMCQTDSEYAVDLYQSMEPYAVSKLDQNQLLQFLRDISQYTDKGMLQIDGETRLGQSLGDGEDHSEFYADDSSITEVVTTLYPLITQEDLQ